MDSESTKADVEARLRDTADAISERIGALREEISTSDISIRDWMVRHPWKSVGGMLAAGLAVGMLFGGSRSRRRRAHADLIEEYIDALRQEMDEAVAAGEEPGRALEKALRDRVPLVVYDSDRGGSRSSGFWRRLFGEGTEIILRTGLSLVARDAIEGMLADVNVEEMMDEEQFE